MNYELKYLKYKMKYLNLLKNQSGGELKLGDTILKEGISPMQTFNSLENGNNQMGGNKASNIFENLAVPAGLLYINKKNIGSYSSLSDYKETKMLPDNIFDEFMSMIEIDKRKKKTRKNDIISSKKKTRKM